MNSVKPTAIQLQAKESGVATQKNLSRSEAKKIHSPEKDGKDIVDGRVVVSAAYFSNNMLGLTHPNVPKFQSEKTPDCSSISFGETTIVREEADGSTAAKREAEIFVDDFYFVANVREEKGDYLVHLEPDFTTSLFNVHQEEFNRAIRKATSWIRGTFDEDQK